MRLASLPSEHSKDSAVFVVKGVTVGNTNLYFNVTLPLGHVVTSNAKEVQVYSPLQLSATHVWLVTGAVFKVCRGYMWGGECIQCVCACVCVCVCMCVCECVCVRTCVHARMYSLSSPQIHSAGGPLQADVVYSVNDSSVSRVDEGGLVHVVAWAMLLSLVKRRLRTT